jgi:hypothetical protein
MMLIFFQEKYEIFKEDIMILKEDHSHFGDTAGITGQNHPSIVEVYCYRYTILIQTENYNLLHNFLYFLNNCLCGMTCDVTCESQSTCVLTWSKSVGVRPFAKKG